MPEFLRHKQLQICISVYLCVNISLMLNTFNNIELSYKSQSASLLCSGSKAALVATAAEYKSPGGVEASAATSRTLGNVCQPPEYLSANGFI